MVRAGTFIAAVGADNEHKQEIDPRLMAQATVVTDSFTTPDGQRRQYEVYRSASASGTMR